MKQEKQTLPRVQVLLSTYNGEKYLEDQIISIINQKNVRTDIFIRDDGSTDSTLMIIEKMCRKYKNRIQYFSGNNLGFGLSFLELIKNASPSYDYFAFADQDDVWLLDKLTIAISKIKNQSAKYKLYASTVLITDQNMNFKYKKDISNFKLSFGSVLVRTRLAGCTMVFNYALIELMNKFSFTHVPNHLIPAHDVFLMILCTAVDGYIFVDENSYILHRRLKNSVTGGGNGPVRRLKQELKAIVSFPGAKTYLVKQLKKHISPELSSTVHQLINKILQSEHNLFDRVALLTNSQLDCGIFLGNLENKIRIILNTF